MNGRSPDGRNILFGSSNNSALKLWSLDTGKCILTMNGHQGCVFTACFSPDGRKCISNSKDGTVKLWDIATGNCICTFDEIEHYGAQKISFKNGGRSIIIASDAIYFYTLDNELHFPGWHDWDEGARPYLDIFLCLHPNWTDDDFDNILIRDLQNRGFGWLRPEGVRVELEKMK